MSGAKRYNMTGVWDYEENPNGRWVEADDHVALEAERDELREQVEALRAAMTEAKYRIEQGRIWAGTKGQLTGLHPICQQKALNVIDTALQAKP